MPCVTLRNKHRLIRHLVASTLLFFLLISVSNAAELAMMAKEISAGIGQAKVYSGSEGATIVIFEEEHDSFTMNLEESAALVRLFTKYGMRDIGLEGYTDTDEPWTKNFSPNPAAALVLLKKGEINSAAFMALGYGVNVHPIEKASEYILNNDDISRPISIYISNIAIRSIKQKISLGTLPYDVLRRYNALTASNDVDGIMRLAIEQDSFSRNALDRLRNIEKLERQDSSALITTLESIVNRAEVLNIIINPASKKIINDHIIFARARQAASKTMATQIADLATSKSGVVGMIIGAYHTPDVVSILVAQKRPVVVISPNSAPPGGKPPAKYSDPQVADLYRGEPIGRDSITKLLRSFENVKNKTPFNARWLQTKSEIYDKVDGLVAAVFGPSRRGDGDDEPPNPPPIDWSAVTSGSPEFRALLLSLPQERFEGAYIFIDKDRIELLRRDDDVSILFSIQIRSTDGAVLKEIWGRAWPTSNLHKSSPDEIIVEITDTVLAGKPPSSEISSIDVAEISKTTTLAMAEDREVLVQVKRPGALK